MGEAARARALPPGPEKIEPRPSDKERLRKMAFIQRTVDGNLADVKRPVWMVEDRWCHRCKEKTPHYERRGQVSTPSGRSLYSEALFIACAACMQVWRGLHIHQ